MLMTGSGSLKHHMNILLMPGHSVQKTRCSIHTTAHTKTEQEAKGFIIEVKRTVKMILVHILRQQYHFLLIMGIRELIIMYIHGVFPLMLLWV